MTLLFHRSSYRAIAFDLLLLSAAAGTAHATLDGTTSNGINYYYKGRGIPTGTTDAERFEYTLFQKFSGSYTAESCANKCATHSSFSATQLLRGFSFSDQSFLSRVCYCWTTSDPNLEIVKTNTLEFGAYDTYCFGCDPPAPPPTTSPSMSPSKSPTGSPTKNPTASPSKNPTVSPTSSPTKNPTVSPTSSPTGSPTSPTKAPTGSPTEAPTPTPVEVEVQGTFTIKYAECFAGVGVEDVPNAEHIIRNAACDAADTSSDVTSCSVKPLVEDVTYKCSLDPGNILEITFSILVSANPDAISALDIYNMVTGDIDAATAESIKDSMWSSNIYQAGPSGMGTIEWAPAPTDSPTGSPTGSPTKNPTGSPTKNPTGSPTKALAIVAPTIEVEVPGTITFLTGVDCSKTITAQELTDMTKAIQDQTCVSTNGLITGCSVKPLTSDDVKCTAASRRLRHPLSRRLSTDGTAVVNFIVLVEAICGLTTCANNVDGVTDVAEAIYAEIKGDADAAIISIVAGLDAASAFILSTSTASIAWEDVGVPALDSLSDYYPDWKGGSGTCFNDNQMPLYMKLTGSYFEKTLKACCERFYGWAVAECMGDDNYDLAGFYPSWETTDAKCLDASTETPPKYMQNNPTAWLLDDVEDCCDRYYSWALDECLVDSGDTAGPGYTGTDEYYVDWNDGGHCVKNCPKDSSDPECGGIAKPWDALFDDANSCCDRLAWVERSECTL